MMFSFENNDEPVHPLCSDIRAVPEDEAYRQVSVLTKPERIFSSGARR